MYLKLIVTLLLVCSTVISDEVEEPEEESSTIILGDDFSEKIQENNYFVKFYAPWCSHCQRLVPTWNQLAELLNGDEESRVRIAKVDCTQHAKVCSDNDVTSYPTLKFFNLKSEDEPVKYRSTRDLPSLTTFINAQLGSQLAQETEEELAVPAPIQKLVELTDETFNKHVSSGKHLIKFYAPWCHHCQKLAGTWEDLANSFGHEDGVSISKIDCTEHRPICKDFDVKGYPTLLWIVDGKKIDKYAGERSLEALKEYVQTMSGEQREKQEKNDSNQVADEIVGGAPVVQLTKEDFEHAIEKGVTFIKYYAPWCGHCQRLANTWNDLATKFVGKNGIKIAKVDCTLADNKALCSDQEVNGFPTLFIYKNGEKITEYNGSRSLDDLHDFVNRYYSSHDEL